ncbi:MAG: hypothetical protein GY842_19125 [bacterium]|nr:hypothetical protein [bacterium]
MERMTIRWVCVGLGGLILMAAACRDSEPSPQHNRDLGTEGQYLLPTSPREVGTELPGNRGIEIPDRNELEAYDANRNAGEDADAQDESEQAGKGVLSDFFSKLRRGPGGGADQETAED